VQDDRLRADDGAGIGLAGRTMRNCGSGCGPWRMSAARFGYRRLHVLLRREGFTVNHKRLFRFYREERLMVPTAGRSQAGFGHAGADVGPAMAE